ncbi:dicarboxylate/amino acid:cation symporter [Chryseotalea sanaruensis]|uniref:Dicarboxylate/amino acid:cation symporter n=1 Tax=Chryseotalea sanaruensis TaxID=2482724 RepID=A0A401U7C9_9BACT|nr:dicarboxylate/amino acid:cation symporter [Chryseotalea sanaruensis]GCC50793.1 dicarboxylate/amino acid:cation symporter [Chryseotalea sanaruensis]
MEVNTAPAKKSRLTLYIIIALVLGILVGFGLNKSYVEEENEKIANFDSSIKDFKELIKIEKDSATLAGYHSTVNTMNNERNATLTSRDKKVEPFALLADIFLRLIKMIVAPLVFTTLVVGVAKLGDINSVGRIGGKTLLWFLAASFMSLLLGMLMVNIFQPGLAMNLPLPTVNETGIQAVGLSLKTFLYHIFPASVFDAMAKNEILQIVVFSLFFGIATAAIGEQGKIVIKAMDAMAHVILKVTTYVMNFAPVAVFGAMAAIVAKQGVGILKTYSIFIGEFYFSLGLLWILLILAGFIVVGKRIITLIKSVREPIILAFSTSSSEAAFPKTMELLQKFGCKDKIVSFVLPLGYSFNLDGSMMYMTFASLFIAQSYGIDLPLATQFSMLLVLMITSKGIAGVPRASLVVIAGTLVTFNIPEAGLALLLGIDPLLDMGRSATNVVGNSVATAVVSKWENALEKPVEEDL